LIVAHGHAQKIFDQKGIDDLIDRLRDRFPEMEILEYTWNSKWKVAASNIIKNLHGRPLLGISYSWGNPWLRWVIDEVYKKSGLKFDQHHLIGPVNRLPGIPYSPRQVMAMLHLGGFKVSVGVKQAFSFRQVNDRPAEKHVFPGNGETVIHAQLVLGTEKNLKHLAGKTWRFGKVRIHTRLIDDKVGHGTIDDHPMIHRKTLARITNFVKKGF